MNKIIYIIVLLVSLSAFLYGAINLWKKGTPLYFEILVCAAGCFFLEVFSEVITGYCNGYAEFASVSKLGYLGCSCFLLSANQGAIHKSINELRTKKSQKLALLVTLGFILCLIFCSGVFFTKSRISGFFCLLLYFPAVPAVYLSAESGFAPEDELGFIRIIRNSNLMSVIFLFTLVLHPLSGITNNLLAYCILQIICSGALWGLMIVAVKGAKQWKI